MREVSRRPGSMTRLFAVYAGISAVPVLVLGVVLALSLRSEARTRGLAQARSEAALVAQSSIEPELDGRPLGLGLSNAETARLETIAKTVIARRGALRLRVRDLSGRVVF